MRAWRLLLLLIGVLAPSICAGAPSPQRSVLIIEQSPGPFFAAQSSAFRSGLMGEASVPISVYTENLDLGRFGDDRVLASMRTFFREKYGQKPIGVILANGSLALDFVLRGRAELWPEVPVVFTGVDEGNLARTELPADVTGVVMQLSLRDMVNTAQMLVPRLKRIALVGNSLRTSTLFRHFDQEIPAIAADLEVIDLTGLPMTDLRQRVSALPEDAAILYTGIFSDGAGFSYVPADALALVAEVANRPIVVDEEWYLGRGAVGGLVIDAEHIGKEAAHLVLRILDGASPADFAIDKAHPYKPVFDWRQLQRWGIAEAQLPAGSEIRYREPNLWDQYRWQIALVAGALLLQALLLVDLFIERWRRRKAEALARRRMSDIAHLDRVATAGELSASIVHEIAQPVGAMLVNANAGLRWLAKTSPDLDEVREALSAVVSAGHRASDVLGSIRAMFKKDQQDETTVDVNELVTEVLALVAGELRSQSVIVETKLGRNLPAVHGNHVQLQQVILNLVMNAVEAMGSVQDRLRKLQLRTEMDGPNDVLITVQDSGPGIQPENVDRIFEHFFTTKSKGMGMGLAICKTIVENHNGRLWVEERRQAGAMFHLTLPGVSVGVQ